MASNRRSQEKWDIPSAVGRSVLARLGVLVALLLGFAGLIVFLVQALETGR